jgi:hypothetical protein
VTDYIKALHILARLAKVHRPAVYLTVDDILSKATSEELDFYYRWCCHVL